MEPPKPLGYQVQDGNGINDGHVRKHRVYAGNSWTASSPKVIFVQQLITQNLPDNYWWNDERSVATGDAMELFGWYQTSPAE